MDLVLILKSILPFYKKEFKSFKINALDIEITFSDGKVFLLTKDEVIKLLKDNEFTVCD